MGQAVISDNEGRMFIVGGKDQHRNFVMDVHMLDLNQDPPKWQCLYRRSGAVNEPEPRSNHQLALWKDKIFVLGGSISYNSCGLIVHPTFNISDRRWSLTRTDLVSINGFL